jgi:DNA-binding MurR/RpiR family transcriptional regulator
LKITTLGIEGFCSFQKAIDQWNEKKEEEEALYQAYLAEQERLKKEEEELLQANFLAFNQRYLPTLDEETGEEVNENEDEEEENIFYDIEELLKEI